MKSCILSPVAMLFLFLATASSAVASLAVCNKTSETVYVAVLFPEGW